jgi:hypothetical protein
VLALARRLRTTAPADARAGYELARALGGELTSEDEAFFNAHPPRPLASDEAYATVLDAKTRAELIDDPDEGPLGELLDLLGEVASRVCSDCRNALVDADLMDAQRIPASSDAAAVSILPQINKAFEGPVTLLHTSVRAKQDRLLLASPPVIVLGAKSASRRAMTHSDHDARSDAALRFQLGRLVELARWRRAFALGASRDDFAALLDALRALAPGATSTPDGERLRGKLPVTHRQKLADKLAALSPSAFDPDAYIAACRRAADRAGLLACGNIVAAVSLAGGPNTAPHLLRLAGSRRYLAVRRALRFKAIPRLAREIDDVTSPFSRG